MGTGGSIDFLAGIAGGGAVGAGRVGARGFGKTGGLSATGGEAALSNDTGGGELLGGRGSAMPIYKIPLVNQLKEHEDEHTRKCIITGWGFRRFSKRRRHFGHNDRLA